MVCTQFVVINYLDRVSTWRCHLLLFAYKKLKKHLVLKGSFTFELEAAVKRQLYIRPKSPDIKLRNIRPRSLVDLYSG